MQLQASWVYIHFLVTYIHQLLYSLVYHRLSQYILVSAHSMFMLGIARKEGEIDLQTDIIIQMHHHPDLTLPQST